MKLARIRLMLAAIVVLVLATMACATLVGEETPTPLTGTVTPVLVEPTTVPPTDMPAETEVETEPTETPAEPASSDSDTAVVIEVEPPSDLDQLFAPFWEAWQIVNRQFVEQPIDQGAMVQGAIDGLLETSQLSSAIPSDASVAAFNQASETPEELQDLFRPFWTAWIRAEAPKDVELMRAAIHGMLAALDDEHTSYMDPDQFVQASIPLDGEYEGIGAWVDPDGEYLTIVSPMPGSPAEAAGLEPGDQVIKVDGEDMTGVDGNLVIRRVLGPQGTEVTLTIRRDGEADFDVVITRDRIFIPSVTGEMLENDLAYVQLFNFGETTAEDLRQTLEELLAENPRGLILDLRNNGGGFLNTAVEVASEFIGEGVLMYEVYGDDTRDIYEAIPGGLATEIPLVVLINDGSASASEILAGAIQDYERAPLVGTKSFGKGSVQNWVPLRSEESAVRVTIALWYTPNERLIHDLGLEPDLEVENTDADVDAGLDPQLDTAIDLLLNP